MQNLQKDYFTSKLEIFAKCTLLYYCKQKVSRSYKKVGMGEGGRKVPVIFCQAKNQGSKHSRVAFKTKDHC